MAALAKEMYGKKYDTLFTLVMSDLVGHIDRLEKLGKVTKRRKQGVFYYKRIDK